MTFPHRKLWDALKSKDQLLLAQTVLPGDVEPTDFDVRFWMPDHVTNNGALSRDYEIEYPHEDAVGLKEGAEIIVGGTLYRVREAPYVSEEGGRSGFFRRAILTRIDPSCST